MALIMESPLIYEIISPMSTPVILVVDDDESHRQMVLDFLQDGDYAFRGAAGTSEGLKIISRENIDLVISDIKMKGLDGLQFMQRVHKSNPDLPFIIITGFAANYDYETIINLGASDFITKPFSTGELNAKIIRILREKSIVSRLHESLRRVKKVFHNTVLALASALEIRDPYTAGHQRRVSELSCAIARALKLEGEQLVVLNLAAAIHDIGKIGVPAEILAKPGYLSEHEMNLIKSHCQLGFDILHPLDFPWPLAEVVRQHHERLDGSGYPLGLGGEDISLEARVIAVADVVEAMSAHRPYRAALDISVALEEISQNRGILYDPKVVDACIGLFTKEGFHFA